MEPEYHKQPHTQDPTKEPPGEEAPLAQGHTREVAADVAEAAAEHKGTVEAEREAVAESGEVGARAPGDHAGEEGPEESGSDGAYPSDGSVDDVLAWVGDDHDRAQEALAQENARPTPRTTLISKLEAI